MDQHLKSHSTSIDNKEVRQQINRLLQAKIGSALTPYIGLEKARQVLAPFSIFIPAAGFMDDDSGSKLFNVNQYDSLVGMNNKGEVVTKTESPYHIYFSYMNCGGTHMCSCKLVTTDELDELVARDNLQEANNHPLVLRVKQNSIADAWDELNWKRNGPNPERPTPTHKETIKAKLKQKGINVSDKEIDDAIAAHKKLKKKLEEARLEEEGDRMFALKNAIESGLKHRDALKSKSLTAGGKVVPTPHNYKGGSPLRTAIASYKNTRIGQAAQREDDEALERRYQRDGGLKDRDGRPMREETMQTDPPEVLDESMVAKVKRALDKVPRGAFGTKPSRQQERIVKKIDMAMDKRRGELGVPPFGNKISKDESDKLAGDATYNRQNHRYIHTTGEGDWRKIWKYLGGKKQK